MTINKKILQRAMERRRLRPLVQGDDAGVAPPPYWLLPHLRRAESFRLDGELDEIEAQRLLKECDLLAEHGLFRLPYSSCLLERPEKNHAVLALQEDAEVVAYSFGSPSEGPFAGVVLYCSYRVRMYNSAMEWTSELHGPLSDPTALERLGSYHEMDREHALKATVNVPCFVSLLATKGVRHERVVPHRPAKLVARDGPAPGRTTIFVRAAQASSTKAAVNAGEADETERRRPRLHLRRGHIRNQAYGPGRKYHRPTYIEPMLVGYREEGVIEHTSYWLVPTTKAGEHN